MKKTFWLLIVNLVVPLILLANDFTLNRGYVAQKGFYTAVSFETKNDLLLLNVTINGRQKKFLLDTGAPTAISATLQKQLRLNSLSRLAAEDINGNHDSFTTVSVDELQVGGMTVKDVPALVISDDNAIFNHLGVDGIIGSNYLRNVIVRISVRDRKIIFTDNIDQLNMNGAYAEHMSTDKDIQSSPVIKIRMGGGITEELLFDTGFSGFYDMSSRQFSIFDGHEDVCVLGAENKKVMYGMMGPEASNEKVKVMIPQYSVGGFVYHNVVAYTSSDDNSKIGAKFLRTADVTLDYINNNFYLQPYSLAGTDFEEFCCMDAYYCKND